MKTILGWLAAGGLIVILGIQLLPYGPDRANPPVRREPAWNAAETRALAVRACFDCHSNQTRWPWYSRVAPVSWLMRRDVVQGRQKLNYSEWDRPQEEAGDSAEAVQEGEMPPWYYPWASLTAAEREALVRGLEATFGRGDREGEQRRRG